MSEPDKTVSKFVYGLDPVYNSIKKRFWDFYKIDLSFHMESMTRLSTRFEEGFDFVPMSASMFETALKEAGFENDKRERHFGFIPSVGTLAALATNGEGYRERGSPSLHCAVASSVCSVHLDNVGFRMDSYGPDAGQHIIDELGWQDKIVRPLRKVLPDAVVDFLHRFHPVVPNSRQFKPFSQVGVEFDIASGRSRNLQQQWRVTIDLTHACSNSTCDVWRKINGKSIEGENQVMLMFKVVGM